MRGNVVRRFRYLAARAMVKQLALVNSARSSPCRTAFTTCSGSMPAEAASAIDRAGVVTRTPSYSVTSSGARVDRWRTYGDRGAAKVRGHGEMDAGGHDVPEAVQCECALVRDRSTVVRPHQGLQQVVMLRYRCATQSVHAGKATLEASSPDMVVQEPVAYAIRLGILPVEVSSLVEGKGFEPREIGTESMCTHRVEDTLQFL